MSKKSKYIENLLSVQNQQAEIMRQIVLDSIHEQEGLVNKIYEAENSVERTLGERLSDHLASFGGSWKFIIAFFIVSIIWMWYNVAMGAKAFDQYPFILLNLLLSCLAAIQAPVILMSQNRQESRDRKRAQDDYLINLKAELENRAMDQKLDLLINELFKELIEIQKMQIHQLERIEKSINKQQNTKI